MCQCLKDRDIQNWKKKYFENVAPLAVKIWGAVTQQPLGSAL